MASVRKSLFINESNEDVLKWFEGVKSPSEAVCNLIRNESAKEREIELLKQIIQQQQETIDLLKATVEGSTIKIVRNDDGKDTIEPPVEEDMKVDATTANSMLSMF